MHLERVDVILETERKMDLKLLLSVIATGVLSFSGVVVETAMNVTFPTLMEEFGVGTSTVQWITTGYLLVLAVIIPASSWLRRRFTTKALFVTAVLLFLTGTILAAAAPVFSVLLLGRLIQGVGTGIALPLMFNIVLEQAPYDKMGLMMGVASLITAVAPAAGPSLGGLIVKHLGWRMIFVVLIPVLLIALCMGILSIRQVRETERLPFDWGSYLLLLVGFSCFLFAINRASSDGWLSWSVLALFVGSVVAIALFLWRSKKCKEPLIRVSVLRCAPFLCSALVIVLVQFICLGIGFLIPNYAQLVLGDDAFVAGCLLLAGCLMGAALAPVSGRLLDKFGAKLPILTGNALILLSAVLFTVFLQRAGDGRIILFYLCFASGQGFTVGTTMTNGLRYLPAEQSGDGNAVINTLQQLAGAAGTSVVSTVVAAAQAATPENISDGTSAGTQQAFGILLVLAVLMLCSSVAAFVLGRKTHLLEARG